MQLHNRWIYLVSTQDSSIIRHTRNFTHEDHSPKTKCKLKFCLKINKNFLISVSPVKMSHMIVSYWLKLSEFTKYRELYIFCSTCVQLPCTTRSTQPLRSQPFFQCSGTSFPSTKKQPQWWVFYTVYLYYNNAMTVVIVFNLQK